MDGSQVSEESLGLCSQHRTMDGSQVSEESLGLCSQHRKMDGSQVSEESLGLSSQHRTMDGSQVSEESLGLSSQHRTMDGSQVSEESDSCERRDRLSDRLSELPDSLILHILSFLPMTEVVPTTLLLSKRYSKLWATIPCLHFCDYPDFRDEFPNFVNRALALWEGIKIHKFNMKVCFELELTSDIDSWLLFAIEKGVEDLHIGLISCFDVQTYFFDTEYYCPPQRFYSCSSIRKLSLVCLTLNIEGNVQWNKLKNLKIEGETPLSEHALNQILCGAPLLEVLDLRLMVTRENMTIKSSNLKMLKISRFCLDRHSHLHRPDCYEENDMILNVWAPNLQSLEFWGVPCVRYLLNVPSLTEPILGLFEGYSFVRRRLPVEMFREVYLSVHLVEKITLSYWCFKILLEMKERDMLVSFSNAKYLELKVDTAYEILCVFEMFPKLMMLVVEGNDLYDVITNPLQWPLCLFEEEPVINSCNLRSDFQGLSLPYVRTVQLTWYLHDELILTVIEILLENAHMLQKLVFSSRSWENDPKALSVVEEKVATMPRSSPAAEVFIIGEVSSNTAGTRVNLELLSSYIVAMKR